MIKDPKSKYERKRSGFLLKFKKFNDDEATIIGYEEGTGKYKKMMGALKVKNDRGIEFKIGSGFDDF
jgi:DNA ligase-1